jgi:cytochrome bd-type quinol oxidase subunit 2
MPNIPMVLILICLVLVIAGLILYLVRPNDTRPGFAVMCVGVILYFVILLARSS